MQPKRLLRRIVVILALIFALDSTLIAFFSLTRPPISHVDAVIVLGAKVGTPALTERALQGLKYYQEGKTDTILLSGGQGEGEPTSEARAMQEVITRQVTRTGGSMPMLILETNSKSTFQNIHYSRLLIPNTKSIVIVSDTYHLARSVILAKRDGFREVYWDAPIPFYYSSMDLLFYYLREGVAMLSYIPKFITN